MRKTLKKEKKKYECDKCCDELAKTCDLNEENEDACQRCKGSHLKVYVGWFEDKINPFPRKKQFCFKHLVEYLQENNKPTLIKLRMDEDGFRSGE